MQTARIEYWNKDHEKRMGLIDKDNSQYSIGIEREFPRASNVADLGGGTGGDAMYFLKNGHSVTVFDISPTALKYARDRAKRLGLDSNLNTKGVDLNDQTIPASDNSFNEVYGRLSTHYFTARRTGEIFREIERILEPGGNAHITLKSPSDLDEMDALRSRGVEIEPNVFLDEGITKSRFAIEQLTQILTQAGLSNFQIREVTERLVGKGQTTRTGTDEFVLNEVVIKNNF